MSPEFARDDWLGKQSKLINTAVAASSATHDHSASTGDNLPQPDLNNTIEATLSMEDAADPKQSAMDP